MKALFILLISNTLYASDLQKEVIYGVDNRTALEDYSEIDFKWKSVSIATMVKKNLMEESFGGVLTKIKGQRLKNSFSVCSNEPNAQDLKIGKCTGFLVAPDILVTAGHCVTGNYTCEEHNWIFEFRDDLILDSGIPDEIYISSKNIYGCKEIIERKYDFINKIDYAVIRLDKKVTDRAPLSFRKEGMIESNADLVMIGHGLGLPQKVSPMGKILNNENPNFFKTNLDAFVGNSGSPVFNKKTGLVEGILVRGENDFTSDDELDCDRIHYCPENGEGCEGEDATRITLLTSLISTQTSTTENILEEDDTSLSCFFSIEGC